MKVNHRQGHSINCKGAYGILDEVNVCKEVNKYLSSYLNQLGVRGVDCTSTERTENSDLSYGVNKNNSNKADYFISIHANKPPKGKEGQAYGCEVWLHPSTSLENKNKANQICNKLSSLGFHNRGVKTSNNLYELNKTNNKAMIVELFFLDRKSDCDLYNKLGAKTIGKALAEGITGKTIQEQQHKYRLLCSGMSEERAKEACNILRKYGNFKCDYEKQ